MVVLTPVLQKAEKCVKSELICTRCLGKFVKFIPTIPHQIPTFRHQIPTFFLLFT